jgi:hypothetical protein
LTIGKNKEKVSTLFFLLFSLMFACPGLIFYTVCSVPWLNGKPGFSGKMFWSLEIPFMTGFTVFETRVAQTTKLIPQQINSFILSFSQNIPRPLSVPFSFYRQFEERGSFVRVLTFLHIRCDGKLPTANEMSFVTRHDGSNHFFNIIGYSNNLSLCCHTVCILSSFSSHSIILRLNGKTSPIFLLSPRFNPSFTDRLQNVSRRGIFPNNL